MPVLLYKFIKVRFRSEVGLIIMSDTDGSSGAASRFIARSLTKKATLAKYVLGNIFRK